MTTNVLVSRKQTADDTVTVSVPKGGELTLAVSGLTGGERVPIEQSDGEGGYGPFVFVDEQGKAIKAELHRGRTVLRIYGAFEGRINKPPTEGNVGVVSYT